MKKGKRVDNTVKGSSFSDTLRRVWVFLKRHKRVSIPAGAFFLTLALAVPLVMALRDKQDEPPEESPALENPQPEPDYEPEPEPPPILLFDYINPLTGLRFSNDETLGLKRPVAVVHNNSHQPGGKHHALPMYGIGRADIIYEVLAEGATTRMLAFYQDISPIPKIGAVRSARTYYLELALSYDAVLVHAGQSPDAKTNIRAWGMDPIDALAQPATHFWRDSSDRPGVSSEHTMFTSGERLMELYEKKTRQTMDASFDNGLRFTEGLVLSGGAADKVTVPFSGGKRTVFILDEDEYYVEQYNAPFVDGEDGGQVAVTNLLILQTSIGVIPGDKEGRLRVDLQSGGSGYYAAGGRYIPITWSRDGRDAPFRCFSENGDPLEMTPGKTYACIISNSQTPTFE